MKDKLKNILVIILAIIFFSGIFIGRAILFGDWKCIFINCVLSSWVK